MGYSSWTRRRGPGHASSAGVGLAAHWHPAAQPAGPSIPGKTGGQPSSGTGHRIGYRAEWYQTGHGWGLEQAHWKSRFDSGVLRSSRRGGSYQRYLPDLLVGAHISLPTELRQQVAAVERSILQVNDHEGTGLVGIARRLLRSEASSSSRIEGIAPSPQQVALAELGQAELVRGVSEPASRKIWAVPVPHPAVIHCCGSLDCTVLNR